MEIAAKEAAKERALERELTIELVKKDRSNSTDCKTKSKVSYQYKIGPVSSIWLFKLIQTKFFYPNRRVYMSV